MTIEINDPAVVEDLLAFYKKDFSKIRRPATDSVIKAPKSQHNKAQALSLGLFDPEIAMVWGGEIAYSQLAIYLPYAKRSKRRIAIFCHDLKGKNQAELALPGIPIFVGSKDFPLFRFAAAAKSLKALLYITDKAGNFNYIRGLPNLVHVFANHGDSDKHSNASPLAPAYDFVMVADANAAQRFHRAGIQLAPDRIVCMGGSAIEDVEAAQTFRDPQNILYMPTWEGHSPTVNFSSLKDVGPLIEAQAPPSFRFRPHPATGSSEKTLLPPKRTYSNARKSLARIAQPSEGKAADFNWSDVAIADVSGVNSEYLFTRKPIIVPVPERPAWQADYIANTALPGYAYLWRYEVEPLEQMLATVKADPMREERIRRREALYYKADNMDAAAKLFDRALDHFASVHRMRQMRLLNPAPQRKAFRATPEGPLGEVVGQIRAGDAVLA